MQTLHEVRKFFDEGYLDYRPNLTVDCAIFGYHEGDLQLLLAKNKIFLKWCLPGGYIRKSESLNAAAERITEERTGIRGLFFKQFKTFGDPSRNEPYGAVDLEKLYELTGLRVEDSSWLSGETVSVGFYAISNVVNATPNADFFSSECRWFPVGNLPELGFDHEEMAGEALSTMRMHLYHFPIGKNLLPEKFTLKEIKLFYEIMSGRTLHVTNFPNKLISLGVIRKINEKKHIGAHRSPNYYKFNNRVYERALDEGLVLV